MKIKRSLLLAASLALLMFVFAGCRIKLEFVSESPSVFTSGSYSLKADEMRLIAMKYKCNYEKCYKDLLSVAFWDMPVRNQMTYEEYIKEFFILKEARALLFLNHLMDEEDPEISPLVSESLRENAANIYHGFSDDEKAYFGGDQDTVYRVLKLYYRASEMLDILVQSGDLEVSDEESRVIEVEAIRMTDKDRAEEVFRRIQGGESFSYLLKTYTVSKTSVFYLSRNDAVSPISEKLFSMKEGEISELIPLQDSFYIFRIASVYDANLSDLNKQNLLAEKRYENWERLFENYIDSGKENLDKPFWENLSLKDTGDFPDFEFF